MGSVPEPPKQDSLGQLLSNLRVCELGGLITQRQTGTGGQGSTEIHKEASFRSGIVSRESPWASLKRVQGLVP